MFRTRIHRVLLLSLIVLLVGCYNTADKPLITPSLDGATTTIAELRNRVVGSRGVEISEYVCLRGRVISSDAEQNFYRSIVVDDNTGAVEVMLGVQMSSALYPEGLEVALMLEGCYASYYRGVLQVGRKAAAYDYVEVDYIGTREAVDRVVVRSMDVTPRSPKRLRIAELERSMCGRLVAIDSLKLCASTSIDTLAGETLLDARWRGYSLFRDSYGDSIAIRTRSYASFANEPIPHDTLSLRGIVEFGSYDGAEECYHIVMRYEEDCSTY